jgi:hypothetical protein
VGPDRFCNLGIREQCFSNGATIRELEPLDAPACTVERAERHPASTPPEKDQAERSQQADYER